PKLNAKLLGRFFHRRRQISPPVNNPTHRFFDGCYHLLDGDVAVSLHHSLASHFGSAVDGDGCQVCGLQFTRYRREGFRGFSQKLSFPNGIVRSVSFVSTTNTARRLPKGRVATSSEQRMRFMESLSLRLADAGSGCCL